MIIEECTSTDVHAAGDGEISTCVGFASNALPEAQSPAGKVSSQTGVSTGNALPVTPMRRQKTNGMPHWYALRTTYGREKKAYDYMTSKGITAFCPSIQVVKLINGKRKIFTESRLPNIFFAHGTEEQIKAFVYDNINLPFLRFYYHRVRIGDRIERKPLIVPDSQMESLRIICAAEADDIIMSPVAIPKFEAGQLVRIVGGVFTGVVGKVARYQGQQRVAVVVDGLVTVCTAYVPSAFLEKITNK